MLLTVDYCKWLGGMVERDLLDVGVESLLPSESMESGQ